MDFYKDFSSADMVMSRHRNKVQEDAASLQIKEYDKISVMSSNKLPVWRKLCFAVGGAPYQITSTVLSFFMSIFLLEVAQIRPAYVSIIVFGGKLWYALTDPICGFLVNRTPYTRCGKYKPWILLTTPLACICYFCFWNVPDYDEEGKLVWYLLFYCLFQGLLSGVHVPYTSLTMHISNSQKERDSITAYRMVFEAIGVLLAAVIQGHFVKKHRKAGLCHKSQWSHNASTSLEDIENQKWSYTQGSLVIICIYITCIILCFFGIKEQKAKEEAQEEKFFVGLKSVLFFKPYFTLSTSVLFLSLAISITQGNLALFCTHSLGMGEYFSIFIIIIMTSTIGTLPIWQMILTRFGKKKTFAAGMMLFVPVLVSQLFLKNNILVYTIVLILAGFSIAVSLLLPWSMLPDVIDDFFILHGQRKDAIFYSFFVFFNKLATGLAVAASQLALQYGGYKTGDCQQPASVSHALRLLMVPGPVLFVFIALFFLTKYPINQDRLQHNKMLLQKMQQFCV